MTAVKSRCLQSQLDSLPADADGAEVADVRSQLASTLRCAAQLTCAQAVACSDAAMAVLRRVLGSDEPTR